MNRIDRNINSRYVTSIAQRNMILQVRFFRDFAELFIIDDVIIYLKRKIKVLVRWIFVAPDNLFSSFSRLGHQPRIDLSLTLRLLQRITKDAIRY